MPQVWGGGAGEKNRLQYFEFGLQYLVQPLGVNPTYSTFKEYVCNSGPSLWSLWGFSELELTQNKFSIYQIHKNVDSYESVLVNGPVRKTHKNVACELSSVCESRVICPVTNSHAFDVSVIFLSMRYYYRFY